MIFINFGWTTAAVKARQKMVTRRKWKAIHASKFKAGDLVEAYDSYVGKQIATLRLTEDPYYESMIRMPVSDYKAEGFAYLKQHKELLPKSMPKSMPYDVSWAGFCDWRNSGVSMWVIRFEYVD